VRLRVTIGGFQEDIALNPSLILAVALGGALGSVARYLVGVGVGKLFGSGFPWGTLIINIAGSFLIGLFVECFALRWNLSQPARVFLTVGICGGFTTFSTFSLESVLLMQRGDVGPAAAYVAASVLLSIVALFGALHLVRALS
jgi:CrcB protein